MHEIEVLEAKNKLATLLGWVESGEEVLITRHGKPVARLVPAGSGFDRTQARKAAQGIIEASQGTALDGLKLKDLINEGRP